MYNQKRISPDRLEAIWPPAEPASFGVPDGPLAVLSAAVKAAWRHKFIVATWLILCIGIASLYIATAAPSYTATATLLLDPRRQVGSGASEGVAMPSLDVGRAESELQVLRSERLLANVFNSLDLSNNPEFGVQSPAHGHDSEGGLKELLGLSTPPPSPEMVQQIKFENFAQRLNVRRVGQSYVVEVSYTSGNPTLARKVANAAVSAYLWQSIAAKADAAKNGAEFLQGRVNALTSQARSAAAAVSNGSLPDAPTPDADARVIGAALQPLRPSAPRKTLILGLGATVGLVGGLLVVALRQALDRRVRTPQDLVQRVGVPCLAVLPPIPRTIARGRRDTVDLRSSTAPWLSDGKFISGVRDLRTSIQLALSNRGHEAETVVALIGCTPRSGTQLIGLGLIRTIQDSGQPAVMIDANVHGSVFPFLAHDPEVTDGASLSELLIDPDRVSTARLATFGGALVLPARLPHREVGSGIYLGAPAFQKVVDHFRRNHQVILDLPPLSASTETLAAARHADAVVIVAEAGRTTVDQLTDAANSLRGAGASVIGAVLNGA